MTSKQRLSASVDAVLLASVEDAVGRGSSPTMSAWVSEALVLKLEYDRRIAALADFVTAFESEHGVITEQEMESAKARARAKAVRSHGKQARTPRAKRTGASR